MRVWIRLSDSNEINKKTVYKKITLKDVAQKAGVSYASVSAVLNNSLESRIRVSEKTKQKILQVADTLGYFPDIMARSLKSGKKSLIAVFTYEKKFPIEVNNEFYGFFVGVEKASEKLGYDLLIINRRPTIDDKFSRVLFADGAIVIGIHKDAESIKTLVRQHFPIVFIGRREFQGIKTNWITFDYETVICELLEHMYKKYVRSFIYLEDIDSIGEASQDKKRFLLIAAAKKNMHIKTYEVNNNFTLKKDFIDDIKNKKAVILSRIKQIEPFETLCKREGIVIGKDILAAVLEDDWTGCFSDWTRWSNKRTELGESAVNLLIKHLADCNIESKETAVKPELIISRTTQGK